MTHKRDAFLLPAGLHVADLTCIRALFAAWVFAYHVGLYVVPQDGTGPVATVLRRGYLGVDGFFILSGLVLALAHPCLSLNRTSLVAFWARRLRRIYPVHVAMIVLLGAIVGLASVAGIPPRQPERFGAAELGRSLLLVQAWGFSDRLAWNYPSWSVSTEWAGYLLFPWLWRAVRGLPALALAVLPGIAFCVLWALALSQAPPTLNLTYGGALARFFPEFLTGMVITAAARRLASLLDARWVLLAGAVLLLAAGLALADACVVAGEAMCLLGLLLAAWQGRAALLAWIPGLPRLGVVSYAFYMSFAPVEMVLTSVWRRLAIEPASRPALFVLTWTVATLLLGFAAWARVERPALRGRRRLRSGGAGV